MKLENQVCSLELSKRLKELGVKQDSLWYWSKPMDINNDFTGDELVIESQLWLEYIEMESAIVYSAFTVAELGNLLPPTSYSYLGSNLSEWVATQFPDSPTSVNKCLFDNKESDARAKLLIHLIEKGIVKV